MLLVAIPKKAHSEGSPDEIVSVSSLNLRKDCGDIRGTKEKIQLRCSLCHTVKQLGKTTDAIVRIDFGESREVLCDRCMDIFVEIAVYGPRVMSEAHRWELSSQVTRAAAIQDEMKCFRCDRKFGSHLFVKYVDSSRWSIKKAAHFLKVCGVCASEMLGWMRHSDVVHVGKFPPKKVAMLVTQSVPIRRWVQ